MFHFCFNIQRFPLFLSNSRATLAAVLKDWVTEGKEVLKSWHSVAIKDSKCGWVGSRGTCCLTEFQKDLVNLILCLTLSNGRHSNKPHCSLWIKCIAFWPPSWVAGTWQGWEIVSQRVSEFGVPEGGSSAPTGVGAIKASPRRVRGERRHLLYHPLQQCHSPRCLMWFRI